MSNRTLLSAVFSAVYALFTSLCSQTAVAQSTPQNSSQNRPQTVPVPTRIVSAIDSSNTVTLRGNVHPMARPEYDRGAVADGQPLHRMLLLLQRSAEQETALRQLLDQQQSKSSENFHAWLAPQQFGTQFGPAPSDVQAVTAWLQSQGFQINRVSAGQTVIEFAGNAGQVRNAFHTQIHLYVVNGQEHTANASDPKIPAALAPVVAGIVSLNNFPAQSHLLNMGTYQRDAKTGGKRPLYTPDGSTQNFPLAPADFAKIYNVTPLWNAGIDGTGQSIAIVGETNISVSDIQNFRALFGLSNNFTTNNIILDGIDPGIVDEDETESDLDIEWSGAVAKNATIKFVTAASTETTSGVHLSALYIVDNNVAPVLSESYGVCEQSLGTTNQFYNALWEQAAAQGITVIISAGDGGSAGCDDFNNEDTATQGLAVSGYASTPFNVAVGGTDFDQVNKWQQFWSPTNDPVTLASALGYIPEIPWNDSCAQLGLVGCGTSQPGGNLLDIVAGSGGPSSIYPKPSWQTGTGVPQDNQRDIPDVSLFASNGFNGTGYILCEADQGAFCQANNQFFSYQQVGGTSASAPAFAGIMALVNHSQAQQNLSNRQGNANYVLYALAKKQSNITPVLNCNASAVPVATCTFNDVTKGNSFFASSAVGNNSVPCKGNTTNCSSTVASTNGILVVPGTSPTKTPAWTTTSGYDMATGLGSVNAQNLATNWQSANGTVTTTTLTLNGGAAVNVTHGSSVPVSIAVNPKAAIGDVALLGALPNNSSVGMARFTLTNGVASGSTSNLAGGTYSVTAHYEGDGTNAPSDSPGVTVIVAPEGSKTFLTVPTFDPNTGRELSSTPSSLVYGSPYLVRVDVTNSAGAPTQLCTSVTIPVCPTGTVSITDSLNGAAAAPLDAGSYALNGAGYTEDQTVNLVGGAHVLAAQYSGDNSFTKGSAAPYTLTVTPAPSRATFDTQAESPIVGQQFAITAQVDSAVSNGAVPTGTVTFFDGATQLPGSVTQTSILSNSPVLLATITTSVSTGGPHSFSVKYSGDNNYAPSSGNANPSFALFGTNTSLTVTPQNIVYGASVMATATVSTSVKTPALSGKISFFSSFSGPLNEPVTQTIGTDANGNTQVVATVTTTPQNSEFISASYASDSNFENSSFQSTLVQVTTPDFAVAVAPTILITAGQTGTATLTITPASNLSSTVTLTCGSLPVGSTCSFTPPSVNLANGKAGTAVLSLTSIGPSPTAPAVISSPRKSTGGFILGVPRNPWWGASLAAGLAALCLFFVAAHRRRDRLAFGAAFAAGLMCVASFALGCGGGGGSVAPPPPPPLRVPTTTTISSSTPKVAIGTQPILTVTVASTGQPTGTVTLTSSGIILASAQLINGTGQAQLPILQPGTTVITAQYPGDANNLASTSAVFNQVITGNTVMFASAQTGVNSHVSQITATIQ
jgi:hypothetical protein